MTITYKYFSLADFAASFLKEGKVYFNTLAYFINCEEAQLRDETEDALVYRPKGGLEINNLTTGRSLKLNAGLISKVRHPGRIYVFCTSLIKSKALVQRFNAPYCVEIFDVEEFSRRLRMKFKNPIERMRHQKLLCGQIEYKTQSNQGGTDHALPEKIIYSKPPEFQIEAEYRHAFTKDKAGFDAYQVEYSLGNFEPTKLENSAPRIIRLGDLRDICRLVVV
jgi:hypothetical protein